MRKHWSVWFLAWMMAAALVACAEVPDSAVDSAQPTPGPASEEAAAIAGMLPDSEFYFLEETEALAPYYAEANARKEAILNTPTAIVKGDTFIPGETYTGTAYYVSPNGNDENDGRSPETAWRSPERTT